MGSKSVKEKGECVICLEKLEGRTRVLECHPSHEFHEICINKWLYESMECPICKETVYEDDLHAILGFLLCIK